MLHVFQHSINVACCPVVGRMSDLWHVAAAGLVFFAFGLNMVDCGGLLGGRLGSNAPPKQAKAKIEPALGVPTIGRTYTL